MVGFPVYFSFLFLGCRSVGQVKGFAYVFAFVVQCDILLEYRLLRNIWSTVLNTHVIIVLLSTGYDRL